MFELLKNKESVTSLELCGIINELREFEGNRKTLRHADLLRIVEKEFSLEDSNERKISSVEKFSYADKKNEMRKAYKLTLKQAKRVLLRESVYVRSKIVDYIEHLETTIMQQQIEIAILREREMAMELTHKRKLDITKNDLYPILQNVGFYHTEFYEIHREIIKRLYGGKWENVMKSHEFDIEKEKPKYRAEARIIMNERHASLFDFIEQT